MATTATPTLSFIEALKSSTNKVLQFQGRARRSEYWWTMLVVYLAILVFPTVGLLLSIATIPLTFRRLHDTGRSGWWWGIGVLLQIAFMIMLIAFKITLIAFMIKLTFNTVMIGIESDWPYMGDGILHMAYCIISFFIAKYIVWILIILVYQGILLVFLCIDSEKGENKYGESPKYVESDTAEELNA